MIAAKHGRVVNRVSPRVRTQETQALGIALLETRLQAMENGVRAELGIDDAAIERIRPPRCYRAGTGPRLVEIHLVAQMHALGADVCHSEPCLAGELPLHVHVPLLHIGHGKVRFQAADRRAGGAERTVESLIDFSCVCEIELVVVELEGAGVGRVDSEIAVDLKLRRCIVDAVSRANHGLVYDAICQAEARSKVVGVQRRAVSRDPVCAHLHDLLRAQ